ncbi:hypothetical protein [Propionibacterium freudenreichii]|uniref:ApeA N-terminal domain 1-containing protein n=1 Tax=Propionibacterium freudenreichii TaxID=1744 RepID=UPI003BAE3BEC
MHHAKWTLAHVLTLPTIDYFRGSTVARTSETAIVRATPDQPCTLNDALRFTRLLQDLVSLATHRAAGVIWLRLTIPAARSSEDNNFHILNRDVNVLYSPARVGIDNEKRWSHTACFSLARTFLLQQLCLVGSSSTRGC